MCLIIEGSVRLKVLYFERALSRRPETRIESPSGGPKTFISIFGQRDLSHNQCAYEQACGPCFWTWPLVWSTNLPRPHTKWMTSLPQDAEGYPTSCIVHTGTVGDGTVPTRSQTDDIKETTWNFLYLKGEEVHCT
jgi:hypothetical protein